MELLIDLLERTGTVKDTLIVFVGDHGPPFSRGKTTCYEFGVHIPFIVAGRDVGSLYKLVELKQKLVMQRVK